MRVDEVRSVVRVATRGRVAVTSSASPVSLLVWRPMLEVSPVATIAEAAARMAADGVSALGVATAAGAAIVTEHDISRAVAAGVDPGLTPVETIAMPNPITVDGSTPIVTAASTMLNAHVRHLLVRTDAGFTGIVSLRDVVAALLQQTDPDLWLGSLRLSVGGEPRTEIWIG